MLILITFLNLVWILNAMPLTYRMVDMSYTFDETTLNFPLFKKYKMENLINGTTGEFNGSWVQWEDYTSGTHVGTHMDAPAHGVKGGMTVEEIPISQFMASAAVIDIRSKAELNPDVEVTLEDLLQWESVTGQTLNGSIVLIRSGWGHKWNNQAAFFGTSTNDMHELHFPGIAAEACQWLVDNRDIKGVGTETLSIDIGSTRDFPSHQIILGHGLLILENIANMDQLPIYGAKLEVFPMKIGTGSGAPTRIIATFPEILHSSSDK